MATLHQCRNVPAYGSQTFRRLMHMSKKTSPTRTVRAIIALATVLILFPPLHWIFGQAWWSFAYIVGSSVLVAALVLILNRITLTAEGGD